MDVASSSPDTWHLFATVEVTDHPHALGALITDHGGAVCFRPAGKSPPGYTWADIFADVAAGHRHAALAVGSFLRSMVNEHKDGRLEGFRILSGQHWMSVAENDEAAMHPQASHWLRGNP